MGLRFIVGREAGSDVMEMAVMYSSTTGLAFGYVFYGTDDGKYDAVEVGQKFLDWCERKHGVKDGDVRAVAPKQLESLQDEFVQMMNDMTSATRDGESK